jgi:hypothetical protein
MRRMALVLLGALAGVGGARIIAGVSHAAVTDSAYTALTPCAVFDSRTGTGAFAGPFAGGAVVPPYQITGAADSAL